MPRMNDRDAEHARVDRIENNNQRGSHGAKPLKRGPAYGGGLKNYGKGAKKVTSS